MVASYPLRARIHHPHPAWPSGQGIATRALRVLLEEIPVRPIRARAASDNAGSLRVLQNTGFQPIATELSFAAGPAVETEETILELP
jgi:hypothetical protein